MTVALTEPWALTTDLAGRECVYAAHHRGGRVCTAGLFVGMLVLLEVGRRIGVRRLARDPEGATVGLGTVEGAVFGLLGLLVAFTFSGAAARFDTRRQLIIEEANAVGTAYLRLELLPTAAQPSLRAAFRQYLAARLAVYRQLADVAAATRGPGAADDPADRDLDPGGGRLA